VQKNNRIWLDLSVAIGLVALLIGGSLLIYQLNFDAMEVEIDNELAQRGQEISTERGCIACHTVDGSLGVGPSWQGMFGRVETLTDGSTVVVDEAYFRESIRNPQRKMVQGYPNVMSAYLLDEEEYEALIAFARRLSE
jgi:cytochrome c2